MEFQQRGAKVEEELGGKRRATTEEWTSNKKRALSSNSDSPVAMNGMVDDKKKSSTTKEEEEEPRNEADTERFRKAAIFRRMRYYQREYARATSRYDNLSRDYHDASLTLSEMEAYWQSIIDLIRRLVDVDAICKKVSGERSHVTESEHRAIFRSRVFNEEDFDNIRQSLYVKHVATENILTAIIALANEGKLDPPLQEVIIRDRQDLMQSNTFLKGEADRAIELYEDAAKERDKYLSELQKAQAKIDRLQSRILNPILAQPPKPHVETNGTRTEEGASLTNGTVKEASPPVAKLQSTNDDTGVYEDLKSMIKNRDERINSLERENKTLRDKMIFVDTEMAVLSEEMISKTPTYRILLNHASKLEHDLEQKKRDLEEVRRSNTEYAVSRSKWEEDLTAILKTEISELKQMVKKRDEDLTRLRQQRDKLEVDFKELDTIQKSKWSSINKCKAQASERRRRMEVMQSEIRRLASRLAANEKQEHLLDFLLKGNDLEDYPSQIDGERRKLEKEVEGLRNLVKASKSGLEDYGRLRVELESARKRLDRYETSDKGALMKQLDAKEDELRALQLKEKESTATMDTLYSEVERLSLSWEELDARLAEQVITLEKWEEEKEKLLSAKAKAENKYFKSMSDAEAKEKERKLAEQTMERYIVAWQSIKENEQALISKISALEQANMSMKDTLPKYEAHNDGLRKDMNTVMNNLDVERDRGEVLRRQLRDKDREIQDLNSSLLKLKDEVQKLRREAERISSIRPNTPAAAVPEREKDLNREIIKLNKVLKCSTCEKEYRNTVITKCMHSFCKSCVEARISHRQRKCPACNIPFAQSEVQPLYFQ